MITHQTAKCLALAFFLSAIFAGMPFSPCAADVRYVSDTLVISVREGQNDDDPILGYLRSETPVEVLVETERFMKIRTREGLEGWAKKKFLVSYKPKSVVIQELNDKIFDLENKIRQLQEKADTSTGPGGITDCEEPIAAFKETLNQEKAKVSKLNDDLKRMKARYNQLLAESKKKTQPSDELDSLRRENTALKNEIAECCNEEAASFFSANMRWFLTGGGVLLLGFIIGWSVKRKRSYRY